MGINSNLRTIAAINSWAGLLQGTVCCCLKLGEESRRGNACASQSHAFSMSWENAWRWSYWVSFPFSRHLSHQGEAGDNMFYTNTHLHAWMDTHAAVDAHNTFRNTHPLLEIHMQSRVGQQREIPEVLTTTQTHMFERQLCENIQCLNKVLEVLSFYCFSALN